MYRDKSLTSIIYDPTTELGNAAEDIAILGQGQVPKQDLEFGDNSKTPVQIGGAVVFITGFFWMVPCNGNKLEIKPIVKTESKFRQ